MLETREILSFLVENKQNFQDQFGISKLGIFGSFARGQQRIDSDIDIIIEMDKQTKNIFEKRMAFRDLISNQFSRNVDVCHKRAIKPAFQGLILKDVIYV